MLFNNLFVDLWKSVHNADWSKIWHIFTWFTFVQGSDRRNFSISWILSLFYNHLYSFSNRDNGSTANFTSLRGIEFIYSLSEEDSSYILLLPSWNKIFRFLTISSCYLFVWYLDHFYGIQLYCIFLLCQSDVFALAQLVSIQSSIPQYLYSIQYSQSLECFILHWNFLNLTLTIESIWTESRSTNIVFNETVESSINKTLVVLSYFSGVFQWGTISSTCTGVREWQYLLKSLK